MEFTLQSAQGFKEEQKKAAQQTIRQFLVPHKLGLQPEKDVENGQWYKADTNTVAYFTAVGYFFAKKLSPCDAGDKVATIIKLSARISLL